MVDAGCSLLEVTRGPPYSVSEMAFVKFDVSTNTCRSGTQDLWESSLASLSLFAVPVLATIEYQLNTN